MIRMANDDLADNKIPQFVSSSSTIALSVASSSTSAAAFSVQIFHHFLPSVNLVSPPPSSARIVTFFLVTMLRMIRGDDLMDIVSVGVSCQFWQSLEEEKEEEEEEGMGKVEKE